MTCCHSKKRQTEAQKHTPVPASVDRHGFRHDGMFFDFELLCLAVISFIHFLYDKFHNNSSYSRVLSFIGSREAMPNLVAVLDTLLVAS